ncbi:sugar phosphate isomerase/epimerase family protein [Amaricoccus macauensis]|uniref:sugar phosphate isomerase/epimerase family protein n=1 Tax=Amaricoccus macauensis TaxID=57001 RepID=UPI003C7B4B29
MNGVGPERLSLNTATVRAQWDLAQCIEGCARHGIGGISPWRDKLHEMGVEAAAKAIRAAGLRVSGLCRGGWFTSTGAVDKNVIEDNRRAVDEAAALEADCLVMVVGGLPEGSRDLPKAWALVEEGLEKTLDYARTQGVKIAIEPLHPMYAADRACVNTLGQALDICDRLGEGIGCAVDVYHVWWDPDLEAQLERAGMARIMAFHLCDWLVPTRDLLNDRGMMGDGVIDLPRLRALVEKNGFEGLNEVEIFSTENWWKRDGDDVLATMVERGRTVC